MGPSEAAGTVRHFGYDLCYDQAIQNLPELHTGVKQPILTHIVADVCFQRRKTRFRLRLAYIISISCAIVCG